MNIQHPGFTQVLGLSGTSLAEERLAEMAAGVRAALEAWARSEGLCVSGEAEALLGERSIEMELTYRRTDGSGMSNRAFSGCSDRLLERVRELADELGMKDLGYCVPLWERGR